MHMLQTPPRKAGYRPHPEYLRNKAQAAVDAAWRAFIRRDYDEEVRQYDIATKFENAARHNETLLKWEAEIAQAREASHANA